MSSSRGIPELDQQDLSEERVEHYLRAHPDFFERHLGLLPALKIPHPGNGAAISLIERQVSVLRENNHQLERKLMDLVQVARDNEGLSTRLHRLALALMEAESLDGVLAVSKDLLRDEFHASHVVIHLFADSPEAATSVHFVDRDDPALAAFNTLFENKRPVCGRPSKPQAEYLFGDQAGEISSAVIVPLRDVEGLGVLALGSPQESRFHSGMGTLFIGYLGELISRAVKSHLRT